MKAFGWSLHEIDETNIETLLPFIQRLTAAGRMTDDGRPQQPETKQVYIDQVMHWFG